MDEGELAQQIKQWDKSGNLSQQIAADLAIRILASRFTELPASESIALEWTTSESTVLRAKQLLADKGMIRKDGTGRYYLPRLKTPDFPHENVYRRVCHCPRELET